MSTDFGTGPASMIQNVGVVWVRGFFRIKEAFIAYIYIIIYRKKGEEKKMHFTGA